MELSIIPPTRLEIPPPWILRTRAAFPHQTALNQLEQTAEFQRLALGALWQLKQPALFNPAVVNHLGPGS